MKGHYPRQKFAIGSFLIVILLGFLSIRALTTSDHLMAWAPQDTNFYFHLKISGSNSVWQKIKEIQLFENEEITLNDLLPDKAEELSIYQQDDRYILLIYSSKKPDQYENLETKILDNDIFLISYPETIAPKKNEIINLAAAHGLGQEPLTASGYLYINKKTTPLLTPSIIEPWQSMITNQPQAWSLQLENDMAIWKSQNPPTNGSIELHNDTMPQNTVLWTHGNNWHKAWQSSFINFPENQNILQAATNKYSDTFNEINNPETSFHPLFTNSFDLYITKEQKSSYFSLKIRKNKDNNPIWLFNFREFWLKHAQKNLPLYVPIKLPDGSSALEINADENLSWQEQTVTNSTIHWLKGADNELIIGYLETDDFLIISNNYANLVDFLYSDDQDSWISLEKMAKKCGFSKNQLSIFMTNIENYANLSQLINFLGPFLVDTDGNICYI